MFPHPCHLLLIPLIRSPSGFFRMLLVTGEFLSAGKRHYGPLSPPGLLHLLVDGLMLLLFFIYSMLQTLGVTGRKTPGLKAASRVL